MEKFFFAVCDCTGHGVPGAMLSIVGHNGLLRCIKEFALTDPGQILDRLALIVEETFSHTDRNVRDGMDISLCVYDEMTREVKWAGANNPVWIITGEGELKEIKGDKQPIGKYEMRKPFNTHSLLLKETDSPYLFSDGYADQFGGPKGKKFKYAQLKKLLLANFKSNMQLQQQILHAEFTSWRGSLDQIDDVCIVGVKI
jgi:serine phosphatase RsbU (regulator of sigma subunit)